MTFAELKNSSATRFGVRVLLYGSILLSCHIVAYIVRFDPELSKIDWNEVWYTSMWELPFKLLLLYLFGQFSGLFGYFSVPDFQRVLGATTCASATLLLVRYVWPLASMDLSGSPQAPEVVLYDPRGVVLIDFIFCILGISGARLILRRLREVYLSRRLEPQGGARRVGIIGAGDVGANLARELIARRGLGLLPVAFFDDDQSKWRLQVHGIPVIGPPEALRDSNRNLELEEAIIAMPSAPAKRIGEVVRLLHEVRLKFETVPALDQIATGKVKVSRLRPVEIQDLLGREPVKLETEVIAKTLRARTVLVTGAGGSIGGELCRQIASFDPKRLLLVDQSEVQMFPIQQELAEMGYGGITLPLIADILDMARMRYIFNRFRPEVVFHAAAHKHVPMMESQPSEAIKNNTLGTAHLAEVALAFEAERFIMISTDKAINPTSVMGASKRLAEIFLLALHANRSGPTRFIAVRFGNVLGSSGSVIPIFTRQIAAGGPVTVTHPEVTRYFMTIPEAAGLVLQSAAQGEGGEIFVLDMGKPIKIADLARQMIELSGLKPEEDIQIEYVGLRPGEKLFEELSYQGENYAPTNHPKIMRFFSQPLSLDEAQRLLGRIGEELHRSEPDQLKLLLKNAVPEYQPYLS